jgi:deoxyribodipyrimidine photo-lyase
MIANRRLRSNFALDRATEWCRELGRPLVILEALRCDYPWASDRLHRFVVDGMAEHATAAARARVTYLPYVEPSRGAGRGLLQALAGQACAVVTDDFPGFFLPRMVAAASRQVDVRFEAVDSNGLLPMRAADRAFTTALSFRAHLQRTLANHLNALPLDQPLEGLPAPIPLPQTIEARWPRTPADALRTPAPLLAGLPIDHSVPSPIEVRGGAEAARSTLRRFVAEALPHYVEDRNQPEHHGTSRLSPFLHFGHISAHDVFAAVMTSERWTTRRLRAPRGGKRDGWWGASPATEAFLDQLITWRELGYNMCALRPDDYAQYASLPDWARRTLDEHRRDRRSPTYTPDDLESARTHDEVWNAAQRQLLRDGWMHGYLRMLWGKKILEWSPAPEAALDTMIAVMNRHALDGRNPNSYSGYFWTLGRYDRPWGPARPVFGTVRYMSSASTLRKLRLRQFLRQYGPDAQDLLAGADAADRAPRRA